MKKEKILKRHHDRADLAGEYKWGDLGQLILLVIFLIVWIADSFFLKYSTFLSNYISGYIQIPLVCFLMICSAYLARSGLRIIFGEIQQQPAVIRKGVFKIIRHPIYLGSILFYLGLFFASFSLLSLVIWIAIVLFYHLIAKHEEKLLLQVFGVEYKNYMSKVPMWIPGFKFLHVDNAELL